MAGFAKVGDTMLFDVLGEKREGASTSKDRDAGGKWACHRLLGLERSHLEVDLEE